MSRHPSSNGSLVAGLILIALGTLFLFDRMWGYEFSRLARTWWPLALIVVGLWRILGGRPRGRNWGFLLIVLGVIFQGARLRLHPLWTMDRLWPVILITIGAILMFQRLRRNDEPGPSLPQNNT